MPEAPPPQAASYRALVVHDDKATLAALEAALSASVRVTSAPSGDRALGMLGRQSFHVVCTEFRMAGVDGVELLRRVVTLPEYTSGLLLTDAGQYALAPSGGRHYVLLKPFEPARLVALVLQLARVAEMKRQVGRTESVVGSSVAAPNPFAPRPPGFGLPGTFGAFGGFGGFGARPTSPLRKAPIRPRKKMA